MMTALALVRQKDSLTIALLAERGVMVRFVAGIVAVLVGLASVGLSQEQAVPPVPGAPVHTAVAAASSVVGAPGTIADGPIAATPAADPTHGLTFDVVSIRHTGMGPSRVTNPGNGDGITITNSSLREIVEWNYKLGRLSIDRLQGAPDWFSSFDENYEIQAKVAPSDVAAWQKLNEEGRRLVFRKVLADRFKLVCHVVNVEAPVYDLVIAKGGLKIKEAESGEINPGESHALGGPAAASSIPGIATRMTPNGMVAVVQRMNMESFAKSDVLVYGMDRPVIDKTGLTGVYTFTLNFSWQQFSARAMPEGASEPTGPDIFTALQQQLGLKLVSGRGSVSHLIVDHVERPSDN